MAKKNILKRVLTITTILLIAAISATLLLTLTQFLPATNIKKNVGDSTSVFEKEGVYPKMFNSIHSTLDNFTDAIMLSVASYDGKEPAKDKALLAYFDAAKTENVTLYPTDAVLFNFGKEIVYSQYKNKPISPDDKIESYVRTYPRYWHGYLIILKPLLMFTNYQTIRTVNFALQILLCLLLIFFMIKKKYWYLVIPFLLAWGTLLPPVLGASLQYSYVFYIAVIASIILFVKNEKWKETDKPIYFFLLCGILTSFFDFLTYPLVTLCVPLIFYMSMNRINTKKDFLKILFFAIIWGIGYVGMWALKWIIASLLTNENVLESAGRSLVSRSAMESGDKTFSYIDVIGRNLTAFCKNPFVKPSMIYLAVTLGLSVKQKSVKLRNIIVFGVIALSPFAWYMITGNHSYIHCWFTCKELAITVLALTCMCAPVNNKEKGV